MQLVTVPDEARELVRESEGGCIEVGQYIGSVERLHRGPQAFTSTFPGGYVIAPHFHGGDQFQIFVGGSARIADHPLDPVTVHYTDAYTAYGPIVCGDDGMTFFNFRARCNLGTEYMPESRKQMLVRGGRSLTAHCRLRLDDAVDLLRLETVVDLHDDGLAAYESIAAPGVRLLDGAAAGGGRFQLVLDGSVELDGRTLPRHSVGYVAAGERFSRCVAGPGGVHLLEL